MQTCNGKLFAQNSEKTAGKINVIIHTDLVIYSYIITPRTRCIEASWFVKSIGGLHFVRCLLLCHTSKTPPLIRGYDLYNDSHGKNILCYTNSQ